MSNDIMDMSTDTTRKIDTLRRWARSPSLIDPAYLAEIANEFERVYRLMVARADQMPWRPIEELDERTRYGDEVGFLLLAPELVDLDCNVHGVGMGYWQDGAERPGYRTEDGSWLACKWDMTDDEWREVPCTPTHYLRLTGASNG
jgi:hypothetical protein